MIHVVFGGQYGSEGKGEFVYYIARRMSNLGSLKAIIRVGGPNAGHTFTVNYGTRARYRHRMRQIPVGWNLPEVDLIIGPGSVVDLEVLASEIEYTRSQGVDVTERLLIDKHAVVITEEDQTLEQCLVNKIGSTGKGIGRARSRHIMRNATLVERVRDPLPCAVADTVPLINQLADGGGGIIIESTQGFGLSLTLSNNYPYATSRDVTPAQILNDVGLSPRLPHYTYAVARTFPIRVAGPSGFLLNEISWEELRSETQNYVTTPELTTVTRKPRRIGRFNPHEFERMLMVCRPHFVAVTFADYLDPKIADLPYLYGDSIPVDNFLRSLEELCFKTCTTETLIKYVSTGPGVFTPL